MVYIGGYTTDDGIGLASLDASTGALVTARTVAETPDPSYLVLSEDGRFLYAVNELDDGLVSAFSVASGSLTLLGQQSTHGSQPCHLAVHPSGRYVLCANYGSGSVSVHPVLPDGSVGAATHVVQHSGSGPNPDRQEGPHAHMVACDPVEEYVFAVDLGTDSVYVYAIDLDSGRLTERSRLALRPGAGPRHIAFQPDWLTAYVINELDSTLVVCDWSPATGRLSIIQTVSTRPADAAGDNFPAAVVLSADGRFVYGSNRGDDTIAVFTTYDDGRRVELVQTVPTGGEQPRDLAISPDGSTLYAANQRSDSITSFTIDRDSGHLAPLGTPLSWPQPARVLPIPV
jgi:6-phosphogluconolactonase